MDVSQKKTKVVCFPKQEEEFQKTIKSIKVGEIEIDEATSYKYLGVIITEITGHLQNMCHAVVQDKTIKAYYALIAKNRE